MSTKSRTAILYQPAKSAMQSGRAKDRWVLEFDRPAPGTPDALMGWNTMPDTIAELRLTFANQEEAEAYARAKGIAYTVRAPHMPVVAPKAYAENFSAGKRKAFDKKVSS